MMRELVCAGVFVAALCAGAAAAEGNPFIGHWTSGDLASCAPSYASDVLSIKVSERQIDMFEQGCDIQSIRKISKLAESGYRLRLLCREGSTTTRQDIMLALVAKSPLHGDLLVRFDQSTGIVPTYQRCP